MTEPKNHEWSAYVLYCKCENPTYDKTDCMCLRCGLKVDTGVVAVGKINVQNRVRNRNRSRRLQAEAEVEYLEEMVKKLKGHLGAEQEYNKLQWRSPYECEEFVSGRYTCLFQGDDVGTLGVVFLYERGEWFWPDGASSGWPTHILCRAGQPIEIPRNPYVNITKT